jgi:MSHA biogenesis protein MshJ
MRTEAMTLLNVTLDKFARLRMRERLLAVVALAAVLYFIVDLALLRPQKNSINALRLSAQSHMTELAAANKTLAELAIDATRASDQMVRDRAVLDALKKQIAEVRSLFDPSDAAPSQAGALVSELQGGNPGVTLVSLKTLPVTTFYMAESRPGASDKTGAGGKPSRAGSDGRKAIYQQGIEVIVKGNYMALLSYMENLNKYPRRLFWSEARLDVSTHPDAVLKLVIYFLSEQPGAALH